jgi:hypothetical protein
LCLFWRTISDWSARAKCLGWAARRRRRRRRVPWRPRRGSSKGRAPARQPRPSVSRLPPVVDPPPLRSTRLTRRCAPVQLNKSVPAEPEGPTSSSSDAGFPACAGSRLASPVPPTSLRAGSKRRGSRPACSTTVSSARPKDRTLCAPSAAHASGLARRECSRADLCHTAQQFVGPPASAHSPAPQPTLTASVSSKQSCRKELENL